MPPSYHATRSLGRGLSVNRAVPERVPPYFESRADAVGATAPIFSATTLAAS
jgi:hypothetical protein